MKPFECAGCGNEIEESELRDALVFRQDGKRVYTHDDHDCVKQAVGARTVNEDRLNHQSLSGGDLAGFANDFLTGTNRALAAGYRKAI